jgi:hypothetical protein
MDEPVQKTALRWLLPLAAVVLILVAGVFVYPLLTGGLPPPEQLESTALDASVSPDQRVKAALQLTEHGAKAQSQMRKVLAESKDSDVRAAAVQGLTKAGDWKDVPQLIKALDDPSSWVRGRAAQAAMRHMGTKFDFDANGSPEERAAAIKKIQLHYQWQDDYRRLHHDAPAQPKLH